MILSMLKGISRKLKKVIYAMRDPISWSALRVGAAASIEHLDVMRSLGNLNTVIDVGANLGQFALLSRRVFPNATIHSFEPMPEIADRFQQALSREPRVHLHQHALGDLSGASEIYVTKHHDSSSLLKPKLQTEVYPGGEVVNKIEISMARLEDVLESSDIKSPALLKIDVQGYEFEVLLGCRTRLQCFDWIFCELSFRELYEGQKLAPEVIRWLHSEGFEIEGVYVGDLTYDDEGRAIQADFLFRRVKKVDSAFAGEPEPADSSSDMGDNAE
jgi:FkbM family methyltransferase